MLAKVRGSKDLVKEPGDIFVQTREFDGKPNTYPLLWFVCPCGKCTGRSFILLGKDKGAPSPSWDFDEKTLTLAPSLNIVGHWHGHLKDGQWSKC
jgi:hypothetical protein